MNYRGDKVYMGLYWCSIVTFVTFDIIVPQNQTLVGSQRQFFLSFASSRNVYIFYLLQRFTIGTVLDFFKFF